MVEKPNYYAIIPSFVRYNPKLSANAKLLYGEITALTNAKGYCWATNSYFAELYNVSPKAISNWVSMLISEGLITSELIYKEGSKEILNRYLKLAPTPPQENFPTLWNKSSIPYGRKVLYPMEEKVIDNSTSINNTSINKERGFTILSEEVVKLYSMYPTRCDLRMASTGKAKKDKQKLVKLLKEYSYEDLVSMMNYYLDDCKKAKSYIKNFSVFLNNLPDLDEANSVTQKNGVTIYENFENIPVKNGYKTFKYNQLIGKAKVYYERFITDCNTREEVMAKLKEHKYKMIEA